MIPSLVLNGYTKETAAGMAAAAGALGPIIPPSIPMIIYGINMNISVPDMFIGRVFPGLFIAGLLIIVNMVIAFKSPKSEPTAAKLKKSASWSFLKIRYPPPAPFAAHHHFGRHLRGHLYPHRGGGHRRGVRFVCRHGGLPRGQGE
jgi:hypothetical protein